MINSYPLILLIVSCVIFSAAVTVEKNITDLLPGCFQDTTNISNVILCVQDFADPVCFNSSAIDDIKTCVTENVPVPTNCVGTSNSLEDIKNCFAGLIHEVLDAVTSCLAPYVVCVQDRIQEIIATINPCVNETVKALGQCARDNAEACKAACSNTSTAGPLFENVTKADVLTCSGIQNNIMDPSCAIVSCCAPCVGEFENMMNCFVNDVLNYTARPCDLQCAASRRILSAVTNYSASPSSIYENCIDIAPGITGNGSEGLALHTSFFNCMFDEYRNVIETNAVPTNPPTPDTSGSFRHNTMTFLLVLPLLTVI